MLWQPLILIIDSFKETFGLVQFKIGLHINININRHKITDIYNKNSNKIQITLFIRIFSQNETFNKSSLFSSILIKFFTGIEKIVLVIFLLMFLY